MKTAKGNVAIENNCDRLRLRWSFRGERYCFALGLPYNKINLKAAQKIVSEIELDMLGGYFDTSLDKYRTNSVPTKTAKLAPRAAKDLYLLPLWNE